MALHTVQSNRLFKFYILECFAHLRKKNIWNLTNTVHKLYLLKKRETLGVMKVTESWLTTLKVNTVNVEADDRK
jgi:hypothetical protein